MIAWLFVLVPASLALWFLATFGFRCNQAGRLFAATFLPAILVTGYLYFDYWTKRAPPPEPGWDIFYALACIVAGAATIIVTFPVWILAEKTLSSTIP